MNFPIKNDGPAAQSQRYGLKSMQYPPSTYRFSLLVAFNALKIDKFIQWIIFSHLYALTNVRKQVTELQLQ